jgi:hypothetical protein
MADTELINYYYGINERLKDIASDQERNADMEHTKYEHIIFNQTFFVGGEGYGLIQKREMALDDLNMRDISVQKQTNYSTNISAKKILRKFDVKFGKS